MIFLCFVILFLYLMYYFYHRYIPPVVKEVPVFDGMLPIIGNGLQLLKIQDIIDFMTILHKQCSANGDVIAVFLGPFPIYIISDPVDASTILNKCLDKMFVYKLIEPLFGKCLVASEVPIWKRNRRVLDMAFKQNILEGYIEFFNSQASRLVDNLSKEVDKGEVDFTDIIARNVLETCCQTTLGSTLNNEKMVDDNYINAIHTAIKIVSYRFFKPWLLCDVIFKISGYKKKFEEALKVIFGLSRKMVEIRKSELLKRLQNNEISHKESKFQSYLDIILENTMTSDEELFTDDQLRDLVDNILLAGFDTTTYELLIILVCIGSSSEVQNKMYEEISNVLGENKTVKKEQLAKLVYLEAVIKESLRLYPIGPIVGRQCDKDIKLRNYTLPAGSSCAVSLFSLNRHKQYWGDDADVFRPERWLNSDTVPNHPAAFASFSPGRRNCIGKSYAMTHLKITLVPLIRKYRLLADHTKLKFELNCMLKTKSGHLIKIVQRSNFE